MAVDRLSVLGLGRRGTALARAALGAFSLAISYVVPVAATLAAGGTTITPLRQFSTPTLEFPPLKAPAVTRNPATVPPAVAVTRAYAPRQGSTPLQSIRVPVVTNAYTTRALPKPPAKPADLPTYEDAIGLETSIAVPDTKPVAMPEPKPQEVPAQ